MSTDSEDNEISTVPDILDGETTTIVIPERSKKYYDYAYNSFMNWRSSKNINSFTENDVLAYFEEMTEKYKSSSLWSHYSMLRSKLIINHNIYIEKYSKLREFLRRKNQGYQAKKSNPLTPDEIYKFIEEAPDKKYLATKVALILGVMGACHVNELHALTIEDFQDFGSAVLVTVPSTKKETVRNFTITEPFYQIYKKYANLRPSYVDTKTFFLNYYNGKCISQNIGVGKFGSMGKSIATFLKLPNPSMYTGHCFRKSSASLIADLNASKRYGGKWKLSQPLKSYVDDTTRNDLDTTVQSTSDHIEEIPIANETDNYQISSENSKQLTKSVEFVSIDQECPTKFECEEQIVLKVEMEDDTTQPTSSEVTTNETKKNKRESSENSTKRRKTNNNNSYTHLKHSTAKTKNHNDQCRIFGDFIVDKLHTFDSRLQTVAQHKIHGILFELEMSIYNNQQQSISQSTNNYSTSNQISSSPPSSPQDSEWNLSNYSPSAESSN